MRYDIKAMVANIKGSEAHNAVRKSLQLELDRLYGAATSAWRKGSGDVQALMTKAGEFRKAHERELTGPWETTRLYAARAHLRGRQHIHKRWIDKGGKKELEHWTMEMQAAYVHDFLRDYELSVEASPVAEIAA